MKEFIVVLEDENETVEYYGLKCSSPEQAKKLTSEVMGERWTVKAVFEKVL